MKKEILAEWNPWWAHDVEFGLLDREIVGQVEKWIKRKEIIGFLGARRCGKTSLMHILIKKLFSSGVPKKNVLFIKCDDERVEKERLIEDAITVFKELANPKGRIFVFMDEVQEAENWESTLKRIYDLEKDTKLFVSGSNFSMQREDLSAKLAGRIAYFEVYPFSFREFLGTKIAINGKISLFSKKDEIKHYLLEYMEFGGFPEVALEKDKGMKNQLLQFYFDSVIYRDVIKRRNIRNPAKMEKMINFFLQNISNAANFTRIGKYVSLSTDSVAEYVKYLQDAYFIFSMPVFSYSVKTQEINPKKIYCVDSGIRNAKGFRFSEDYGRIAENIVFIELKRRNCSNPLAKIFYWRDKSNKETDFLLMNGKAESAVQVCWNMKEDGVKKRETDGLVSAMKELNLKAGLAITEDYECEEIVENRKIKFVPLWMWLMENDI